MIIKIFDDKLSLGRAAAHKAADSIRQAIKEKGQARIIAATGASQFELLDALTKEPGIAWERVELFHLDEYIGLPASHPASFRNYLRNRLIDKVGITHFHLLDGEQDPAVVIRNVGSALQKSPIDVAFVGIGKMATLPSTILRLILKQRSRTWWLRSTKPVESSSLEKAGSGISLRFRNRPYQ